MTKVTKAVDLRLRARARKAIMSDPKGWLSMSLQAAYVIGFGEARRLSAIETDSQYKTRQQAGLLAFKNHTKNSIRDWKQRTAFISGLSQDDLRQIHKHQGGFINWRGDQIAVPKPRKR